MGAQESASEVIQCSVLYGVQGVTVGAMLPDTRLWYVATQQRKAEGKL